MSRIPWVVLDSTVLSDHDRYLESPAGQLLREEGAAGRVRIAVPEVVAIEANAAHLRAVRKARDQYLAAREALTRLRAPESKEDIRPLPGYRPHLEKILRDAGGLILPVPMVLHPGLVEKAAHRRRPFDDKGDGYRDALVWETVLELLKRDSEPLMFVSGDRRAFSRSKERAELAADLVSDLRERGQVGRVQLYFDLRDATADIPRVQELTSAWQHRITENPELAQALTQKLLEIAYADATPLIAADVVRGHGDAANPRFVSFSRPQDLRVQEAYVSAGGTVLLDVELTVEYTIEYEVMLPTGESLEGLPLDWATLGTSSTMTLTFEVIQHDPDGEPKQFGARLTAWSEPSNWPPRGKVPPASR